jgi:hypothetical protein
MDCQKVGVSIKNNEIMKTNIFILFCFLSFYGYTQDVHITLIDNSVKVRNKALFFDYRVENKAHKPLILYNIQEWSVAIKTPPKFRNKVIKHISAKLDLLLFDKNNELPGFNYLQLTDLFNPLLTNSTKRDNNFTLNRFYDGKYILLKQGESMRLKGIYYLRTPHSKFPRGKYRLQLQYYATEEYRDSFLQLKTKKTDLNKYMYFIGEVKSNIVSFRW